MRRKVATKRRAGRLRGLAKVDAERLRLVSIELNRDLGRKLRPLLFTLVAPLTVRSSASTFCAYKVGSPPVTSVTSMSTG